MDISLIFGSFSANLSDTGWFFPAPPIILLGKGCGRLTAHKKLTQEALRHPDFWGWWGKPFWASLARPGMT